jgi:hypothetical protein
MSPTVPFRDFFVHAYPGLTADGKQLVVPGLLKGKEPGFLVVDTSYLDVFQERFAKFKSEEPEPCFKGNERLFRQAIIKLSQLWEDVCRKGPGGGTDVAGLHHALSQDRATCRKLVTQNYAEFRIAGKPPNPFAAASTGGLIGMGMGYPSYPRHASYPIEVRSGAGRPGPEAPEADLTLNHLLAVCPPK